MIFTDLIQDQSLVENWKISSAIVKATTGIQVIDIAIKNLYKSGYLHNHLRMYIASISCNIAHSHWLLAAKWMYFNLLDGDLASNHLSWQWVAGTFSKKKYFVNQENFNKYFSDHQQNTFLDVEYGVLPTLPTPEILKSTEDVILKTVLPKIERPVLENKKTLIYNYYNMDFSWKTDHDYQRILLLEPSFFEKYPVNENCIQFILKLAENIEDIKIFTGEFAELNAIIGSDNFIYKEHPTNLHYLGVQESRKMLTGLSGNFPSFFNYWKKAKKVLLKDFEDNNSIIDKI